VFTALSVRVPLPFFINAPVPLNTPLEVTLPEPEKVAVKPPLMIPPDKVRVAASDAIDLASWRRRSSWLRLKEALSGMWGRFL